jgi:hypothetical protein
MRLRWGPFKMIRVMYKITPHDTVTQAFVLRRIKDRLVVMDEYQDLVCKKCGKVDEKAALTRGIFPEVVVKSKRPFLASLDDLYLVDQRAREVLSRILPDELDYYPIPSSQYDVASPKVWLQPEETDPGFRFVRGQCKGCGRPGEVIWGNTAPTIAQTGPCLGVNLESTQGARVVWLVSEDVADQLKEVSPPLTGMVVTPKEVEDGRGA